MNYPPDSKATFYYRLKSVDGLRLNGEYSADSPDWFLKRKPTTTTITFHNDGTFQSNGFSQRVFDVNGNSIGFKDNGSGTYEIKDFTVVFRFSDGVIVRRPFLLVAEKLNHVDAILIKSNFILIL